MSTTLAAAYPNALGLGQAAAPTQVAVPSVWPPASSARAIFRVQSVPALTRSQARVHAGFGWIWLAANLLFWFWWLQPERVGAGWLYALLSLALAYDATILPTAYLFFVGRMRHPRPVVPRPGLRVALITLCVPAQESLDVIAAQLEAMARVHYPHDSWVLDEGNDPAVRKLAASLGVSCFTRAGIDRYNQAEAPFKARTKAGNVNAWLDAHGSQYDFFVQFDIDHRPRPEYLDRVLGYFDDRQVAWVQAPSTYGNLENWVARGAAEQELILQGPLQRGFYGHSETPFIIGSHCTYRMSAIRQIGGFQPTRAEDHLDTVMLAAGSYRGVYVPEVIAVGLGPDSFETYLRQQFAWAVSMIQVLGTYTPRLVGQLPLGKALQFLFAETWYPLFGLSMLILFLTPVAALLVGQEPAHASLWQFVLASAPLQLTSLLFWWWTRRWHVPFGLGLSWRGVVLHIARWPIVLWALVNVLLRVRHPYMITPKNGRNTLPTFALRNQAIYLIGALTSLSVVWLSVIGGNSDRTRGYLLFAILGAAYMVVVVLVNTTTDLLRLHNAGVAWYRTIGLRLVPLLVVGATVLSLGLTVGITAPLIATAATWTDRQPPPPSPAEFDVEAMSPTTVEPITAPLLSPVEAPHSEPLLLPGQLRVGAFDPSGSLSGLPLTLEHSYVLQSDPVLLNTELAQAGTQRIPLVTVEPFAASADTTPVLERIVRGQSDDELVQLAHVVQDSGPSIVLIRWAHEMDLNLLYPWSTSDSALYRAAFRHVVEVFRAEGVTNARWVWSPAGQGNALAYYPGDDVVDYVGLTVLGDAGWDAELGYEPRQSMADILRPRYNTVEATQKPLIIAELGVSGTAAEQAGWLNAAAGALSEFPRLEAVVYFNDRNAANNWRGNQPDWVLKDPQALAVLVPQPSPV